MASISYLGSGRGQTSFCPKHAHPRDHFLGDLLTGASSEARDEVPALVHFVV